MRRGVLVLGSFVADLAFRTPRLPGWGETVMGEAFTVGPGGKGSNQAVAAARAGLPGSEPVRMLSKVGDDAFGQIARSLWAAEGVDASLVGSAAVPTGAAAILIAAVRGDNAIIVAPGACFTLSAEEVDRAVAAIRSAGVLLAQLELPIDAVECGLRLAREAGVITILNPAPAVPSLSDRVIALCDFLIPNETEASALAGLPVTTLQQAEEAADALVGRGARNVIVTLGGQGSLLRTSEGRCTLIAAVDGGTVLDTTGAGDAFCGAFAAALAEGRPPIDAAQFASAAAGISVTRAGTALSMPHRIEIDGLRQKRG